MKKTYIILSVVVILTAIASYKIGSYQGMKNGVLEGSIRYDNFWTLLTGRSNQNKELLQLNEGNFLNLVVPFHAQLEDPLVNQNTKERIDEYILIAKDYVKHLGQFDIQEVELPELPFEPDLYIGDRKVPTNYFELVEKERNRIFQEVWEEDSLYLDAVLETKEMIAEQDRLLNSEQAPPALH